MKSNGSMLFKCALLLGVFPFIGTAAMLPTTVDSIDTKVRALLSEMSLEAKLGQVQQVSSSRHRESPVEELVKAGRVGSVLNEVDPDHVRELQRLAVEESPHGIPLIIGRDVIHGFRTIAPIPLGLSATWNPSLVEAVSAGAAKEARAVGTNWTFAPMVDVTRDPRWGRVAESPGEDPLLASIMARAMVRGFQGDDLSDPDRIAACAKHFAAYGAAEGGRDYNTAWVPHQQLWEVYLPPFRAAVDAGVATFMSGFNDLNGIPATGNAFLLDEVLRERWGFEGFVVSDWGSVEEMIPHGIAAGPEEAALLAARAGVDMEMVSTTMADHLAGFIEDGRFSEERLDRMVANILRVKFALGLFENPYPPEAAVYPPPMSEAVSAVAKQAAIESFVLLKNDGAVLPIEGERPKIALIGPLADAPADQLGTWIFDGQPADSITPLAAFRGLDQAGSIELGYAAGLTYSRDKKTTGFAEALAAAEAADVIIFCGGEEAILSGEAHSRARLHLPGAQEALLHELAQTGKPLVLVVMAGRPLVLEPVLPEIDALLYAWHPGTFAGPALADVLTGVASPSGKLPITFPKAEGQIPIYYGHRNTGRPFHPDEWTHIDDIPINAPQTSLGNRSHYLDLGHEPRFVFGAGMTYTRFDWGAPAISRRELSKGQTCTVSVTVTNSGERAGREVVQLYMRDLAASITRPVSELKAFEKIALAPGESRTVEFEITPEMLAFPDSNGDMRLEPGDFTFSVGPNSRDLQSVALTLLP